MSKLSPKKLPTPPYHRWLISPWLVRLDIMNTLDDLLLEMLRRSGSDLHLTVGASAKIRVDGHIERLDDAKISAEEMDALLRPVVPDYNWKRFQESGDCDLAYAIPDVSRFRMNLFKNSHGIATVLRQIPTRINSLEEMGLPDVLSKITKYRGGLVLVTGPTGSGKSTTLAAMINQINTTLTNKIVTLEDPVEFTHTNKLSTILHREVGKHTESFETGLRGIMKSDPDVVLIGELRDKETMRLAMNCASMGTLVFATLHTNSATKTIDRIIDAFPAAEQNQARIMLATSIRAIVSQLLCNCKDGGRVAAHEILLYHNLLPVSIRTNALASIQTLIQQSGNLGMISMDASIRKLLDEEIITPQEAYMKAQDKTQFAVK